MPSRIIINGGDLDDLATFLGTLKLPITVEWVQGRDRTGQQNKLMWLWASEAAYQRGDMTPDEVQREWKLRHGVPILREDSSEFRTFYDKALRGHPYPIKLEAMRFVPVTSDMKVKQMVRFMDTIERECADQGIRLTAPDPELSAHMTRHREAERKAA